MNIIKTLLLFLVSTIIGFGFWYLIFWFITSEQNLFLWGGFTKVLYLIFSFAAMGGILEETNK